MLGVYAKSCEHHTLLCLKREWCCEYNSLYQKDKCYDLV